MLSTHYTTIVNLIFVLLGLVSAPLWKKFAEKRGSRKTFLYSLCTFILVGVLFPFIGWTFAPALILAGVAGIANAGTKTSFWAVNSETIDNANHYYS